MRALNRYKYHLIAVLILITMLLMGVKTRTSQVTGAPEELPKVMSADQLEQALELIPEENVGLTMAASSDIREFILNVVKNSLSEEHQDYAFEIAHAVIVEANHNQMDPLFLLAVITTESKFNVDARGTHGEIGLMQVLPKTAAWIAKQSGIPEDFDLKRPSTNIRIGATYFAQLRHTFKRKGRRYVAAYNMGSLNVRRLLASNTEPQVYPTRVLNNYEMLYQSLNSSTTTADVSSRSLASVK